MARQQKTQERLLSLPLICLLALIPQQSMLKRELPLLSPLQLAFQVQQGQIQLVLLPQEQIQLVLTLQVQPRLELLQLVQLMQGPLLQVAPPFSLQLPILSHLQQLGHQQL